MKNVKYNWIIQVLIFFFWEENKRHWNSNLFSKKKDTEIQISLASLPPPDHWRLNQTEILAPFVYGKQFSLKINSKKVNYFLIFDSVIKNKLKNTFQCLIM